MPVLEGCSEYQRAYMLKFPSNTYCAAQVGQHLLQVWCLTWLRPQQRLSKQSLSQNIHCWKPSKVSNKVLRPILATSISGSA